MSSRRTRLAGLSASLLVLVIFAGIFSYGVYRIQFGINLSDEGLYLAAPMRYAQGDLPFRDEILNPPRMFDIVLAPLFYLAPELGVYKLRLLWLVLQFGSMLALYRLLRRFTPDLVAALACSVTVWYAVIIWTPGYHSMSAVFFVASWALWLSGCLGGRRAAAVVAGSCAGLLFFVAALCFVPLLAVLVLPGGVLLRESLARRWTSARFVATTWHLATFLLLSVVALLCAAYLQIIDDWIVAQRSVVLQPNYTASPWANASWFFVALSAAAPALAGVAVLVLGMFRFVRTIGPEVSREPETRWVVTLLLAAFGGCLLLGVASFGRLSGVADHPLRVDQSDLQMIAVALGLHLGVLVIRALSGQWGRGEDWTFTYWILLGGSLIFALLHGVLSTMPYKAMFGLLPLFATGVVGVSRSLLDSARGAGRQNEVAVFMVALCVAAGIFCFRERASSNYQGRPIDELGQAFAHPLLSGIRDFPRKVRIIEGITAALESRVAAGDLLLVYDNAPLLYYLTQTRPALDLVWPTKVLDPSVRARSVEKMIENRRMPRFAVRVRRPPRWTTDKYPYSTDPAVDPIHAFVHENFRRVDRSHYFEIWELETGRLSAVHPPAAQDGAKGSR